MLCWPHLSPCAFGTPFLWQFCLSGPSFLWVFLLSLFGTDGQLCAMHCAVCLLFPKHPSIQSLLRLTPVRRALGYTQLSFWSQGPVTVPTEQLFPPHPLETQRNGNSQNSSTSSLKLISFVNFKVLGRSNSPICWCLVPKGILGCHLIFLSHDICFMPLFWLVIMCHNFLAIFCIRPWKWPFIPSFFCFLSLPSMSPTYDGWSG